MSKFSKPLIVLLLCLPSTLLADEPDPRVRKILDSWKAQLTQMKSYHLKAKVFVYDSVFQVERRANLEAAWSPAGHRIVRWTPAKIENEEQSEHVNSAGDRYKLEDWEQAYIFSPAGKSEIHQINYFGAGTDPTTPTLKQWVNSLGRLLLSIGFLHPPSLDQPIDRIDWTIVAEDDDTLTLQGLPQSVQEKQNFSKLTVVVSTHDDSLRSIEVTDLSKTTQTLFRVIDVEVSVPLPNNSPVFHIPDGGSTQVYPIPEGNKNEFGR